jgi:predicted unusual protein kinase regulating ubiquinone biosynthesis (AarF/ABC1/UbiB family)
VLDEVKWFQREGPTRDTGYLLARATKAICQSFKHCYELYSHVSRQHWAHPATPLQKPFARGEGVKPDQSATTRTIYEPGSCDLVAGRFRILRFVGVGGMGQVYQAQDLAISSKPYVALKIIRPEISCDPMMVARFEREIEMGKR